jgi:hypothetical protein
MSVTLHRTNTADVTTATVNGQTYYVTKMGPKAYGVATGNRVVDVAESPKAAKAVVAADAAKGAPETVEAKVTRPTAEQKARTAEVRRWAIATDRHSGTRGRLPERLYAEYDARPRGPWRTRANKFVKTPKDAVKVA